MSFWILTVRMASYSENYRVLKFANQKKQLTNKKGL